MRPVVAMRPAVTPSTRRRGVASTATVVRGDPAMAPGRVMTRRVPLATPSGGRSSSAATPPRRTVFPHGGVCVYLPLWSRNSFFTHSTSFENERRMNGIVWISIACNEGVCLGMIEIIVVRPACVPQMFLGMMLISPTHCRKITLYTIFHALFQRGHIRNYFRTVTVIFPSRDDMCRHRGRAFYRWWTRDGTHAPTVSFGGVRSKSDATYARTVLFDSVRSTRDGLLCSHGVRLCPSTTSPPYGTGSSILIGTWHCP